VESSPVFVLEGKMHSSRIALTYQVFQILATTDEKHPLNAVQIMEKLNDWYRIDCKDRRVVYNAENLLEEMGYPIIRCNAKQSGVYMLGANTLWETKMRIDSIGQSKLLSRKAKKEMLDKLYESMPEEYRRILKSMVTVKAKYQPVSDSFTTYIDTIIRCIYENKQVDFQYVAYTIEMEPYFKHHMKMYRISPYMVYFSGDTCYLIGSEYDPDEGIDIIKHFRVDRIFNLSKTDQGCRDIRHYYPINPTDGLSEYVSRSIDHYGNEEVILELDVCYSTEAMYIIRDKCGEEFRCHRLSDDRAIISFRVRTGPTLIGWIMQNARLFKVVGPQKVVDEVRRTFEYGYMHYSSKKEFEHTHDI